MENDSLRLLLCSVGIVQEKVRGVNKKKPRSASNTVGADLKRGDVMYHIFRIPEGL